MEVGAGGQRAGRRTEGERPARVVLGLRDARLRQALGRKLEEEGSLGVVGTSSSTDRMVALAGRVQPDVVLVDERLTADDGHVGRLRAASEAAVVVLLDPGPDRQAPLPRGANAYVGMRPVDELAATLVDVAAIAALCRSDRPGRG